MKLRKLLSKLIKKSRDGWWRPRSKEEVKTETVVCDYQTVDDPFHDDILTRIKKFQVMGPFPPEGWSWSEYLKRENDLPVICFIVTNRSDLDEESLRIVYRKSPKARECLRRSPYYKEFWIERWGYVEQLVRDFLARIMETTITSIAEKILSRTNNETIEESLAKLTLDKIERFLGPRFPFLSKEEQIERAKGGVFIVVRTSISESFTKEDNIKKLVDKLIQLVEESEKDVSTYTREIRRAITESLFSEVFGEVGLFASEVLGVESSEVQSILRDVIEEIVSKCIELLEKIKIVLSESSKTGSLQLVSQVSEERVRELESLIKDESADVSKRREALEELKSLSFDRYIAALFGLLSTSDISLLTHAINQLVEHGLLSPKDETFLRRHKRVVREEKTLETLVVEVSESVNPVRIKESLDTIKDLYTTGKISVSEFVDALLKAYGNSYATFEIRHEIESILKGIVKVLMDKGDEESLFLVKRIWRQGPYDVRLWISTEYTKESFTLEKTSSRSIEVFEDRIEEAIELRRRMNTFEKEISQIEDEIVKRQKEISKLEEKIREKEARKALVSPEESEGIDREIGQLEREIEEIKEAIKDALNRKNLLLVPYRELERQLEDLRNQIELERQIDPLEEARKKLEDLNLELTLRNENLERARQEVVEQENLVKSIESEIETLKNKLKEVPLGSPDYYEILHQISLSNSKKAEAEEALQRRKEVVKSITERIEMVKREIENVKSEISKIEVREMERRRRYEELKQEGKISEEEMKRLLERPTVKYVGGLPLDELAKHELGKTYLTEVARIPPERFDPLFVEIKKDFPTFLYCDFDLSHSGAALSALLDQGTISYTRPLSKLKKHFGETTYYLLQSLPPFEKGESIVSVRINIYDLSMEDWSEILECVLERKDVSRLLLMASSRHLSIEDHSDLFKKLVVLPPEHFGVAVRRAIADRSDVARNEEIFDILATSEYEVREVLVRNRNVDPEILREKSGLLLKGFRPDSTEYRELVELISARVEGKPLPSRESPRKVLRFTSLEEPIKIFDRVVLRSDRDYKGTVIGFDSKVTDLDYVVLWDKPIRGCYVTEAHPSEIEKVNEVLTEEEKMRVKKVQTLIKILDRVKRERGVPSLKVKIKDVLRVGSSLSNLLSDQEIRERLFSWVKQESETTSLTFEEIGYAPLTVLAQKAHEEDVIELLARSRDPKVREAIVQNSSTPARILRELAKDSAYNVRKSIVSRAFEVGDVPREIIEILANDSDEHIRNYAQEYLRRTLR